MVIGFHWAKFLLGFSFHPAEMERGNKFVLYNINIQQSEGIVEYRRTCWKILISLALNPAWKDAVLLFLDSYADYLRCKPDYEIVSSEVEYIDKLLSILKCDRISYLRIIQSLLLNGKKMNVNYNEKWAELLIGKEWSLYQLLENNFVSSGLEYKEYEKKRNTLISEYGKNISASDIKFLVQRMNNILSDILVKRDSYGINQGFELLVQQFDEGCMQEFIREFIQYGENISISPWIVLAPLNKSMDSAQLLSFIKQADFPQKNEWLFSFFVTLPEEKVNADILQEFLIFLKSDSDKTINSSPYRRLKVLDKFLKIEPNIYPVACAIIFEKLYCSPFIVKVYFELLFYEQVYTPKELLFLFQKDIELLQSIYFYMLKKDTHNDLKGVFLIEFLSLGESWIQKYSEIFWEHVAELRDVNRYRNSALWKTDNYKEYFDYLFYHFPKDKSYEYKIGYAFKKVLIQVESNDIIKQHQQEWLEHIIIDNISSDKIVMVFQFICELNESVRRTAIKVFLDNNQDFETFNKLSLVPNHWSCSGSFVPAYKKQIDFLESLYPLVDGIKFLKHRSKIKSQVEMLYKMIKKEEIEEIVRKLYM